MCSQLYTIIFCKTTGNSAKSGWLYEVLRTTVKPFVLYYTTSWGNVLLFASLWNLQLLNLLSQILLLWSPLLYYSCIQLLSCKTTGNSVNPGWLYKVLRITVKLLVHCHTTLPLKGDSQPAVTPWLIRKPTFKMGQRVAICFTMKSHNFRYWLCFPINV